jgi:hypothetical protein
VHMGNKQKGWGGGVYWVCVEGEKQLAEYCPEKAVSVRGGKNPGLLSEQCPSSYGVT